MRLHDDTILITGGGSGIGRALAKAFAEAGNFVIVAGRRLDALRETAKLAPNISTLQLDVGDANAIARGAEEVVAAHPQLNVLVNNAGIMRAESLLDPKGSLEVAEATVATNLLGPIRLTQALLPQLRTQARGAVINVSSGLAFVPLALTPTYCATKAAIHSYTESLRWQLRNTAVEVLEVVPPYVQTELMDGKNDPAAMPLEDYIRQTMEAFADPPPSGEIRVERVDALRQAAHEQRYEATFRGLNEAREAAHRRLHGKI